MESTSPGVRYSPYLPLASLHAHRRAPPRRALPCAETCDVMGTNQLISIHLHGAHIRWAC